MVPTVVIAQCVRASLTEKRIIQLKKEGYSGDDSYTEVQELLEGDQFKIKVLCLLFFLRLSLSIFNPFLTNSFLCMI